MFLHCAFSFLVDLRKGVDDFMGRAFYLLGTIPSKGERRSLNLYSHSAKSKLGSIKVDLRIRGLREGLSKEKAMVEHLRLTRAVVDSESRAVSHTTTNQTFKFYIVHVRTCTCINVWATHV